MSFDDRLKKAGQSVRAEAHSRDVPNLERRGRVIRIRHGLAVAGVAVIAALALGLPTWLAATAPDVVDPADDQGPVIETPEIVSEEPAALVGCGQGPIQLDGAIGFQSEVAWVIVPSQNCGVGFEGVFVRMPGVPNSESELAEYMVVAFGTLFEWDAGAFNPSTFASIGLSGGTVQVDVHVDSLPEVLIEGLAITLLRAVEFDRVEVTGSSCPDSGCEFDRASVGLPETHDRDGLLAAAPLITGMPDFVRLRDPLPFCGFARNDSEFRQSAQMCRTTRVEVGLPSEHIRLVGDEVEGVFRTAGDGTVTGYLNGEHSPDAPGPGWWVMECSASAFACTEPAPIDNDLVGSDEVNLAGFTSQDLLMEARAVAAAADGQSMWASISTGPEIGQAFRTDGLLALVAGDGQIQRIVDTEMPYDLMEEVEGVLWMARAGDGGLPVNAVARFVPGTGVFESWDIGDFSPTAMAIEDGMMWLVQGGTGYPPEIAVFEEGVLADRWPLPAGSEIRDIDVSDGVAWLVDESSNRLISFDVEDGDVGVSVGLPIEPSVVEVFGGAVWVGSEVDEDVMFVSPSTGEIQDSAPFDRALTDPDDRRILFVAADGTAWTLEPEAALVATNMGDSFDTSGTSRSLLTFVGDEIWWVDLASGRLERRPSAFGTAPALPQCLDESLGDTLDFVLATVDGQARWGIGGSGLLAGRLPSPPPNAVCATYSRGDLGQGEFADALLYLIGDQPHVVMLPSLTPIVCADCERASFEFNGEQIAGTVDDGVFVGTYDEDEVILVYPFVGPSESEIPSGFGALLATPDGLVAIGTEFAGLPDDLEATRLANQFGLLAGQRADGSMWAFVDGEVLDHDAVDRPDSGPLELVDVAVSAGGRAVLVLLAEGDDGTSTILTLDVLSGVVEEVVQFEGEDVAVAATIDGVLVARDRQGCLIIDAFGLNGQYAPSLWEAVDCGAEPIELITLAHDGAFDRLSLVLGYRREVTDGRGPSQLRSVSSGVENGRTFEPPIPPPIAVGASANFMVALMPFDQMMIYRWTEVGDVGGKAFVDPDVAISVPAGTTDFVLAP